MKDLGIGRRRVIAGMAAVASGAIAGCSKREDPAPPKPEEPAPQASLAGWKEISFEPGEGAPEGQRALVFGPPNARDLPMLVALHGRGESGRGLDVGARGWRDDYRIGRLLERLKEPPLTQKDLLNMVSRDRLARLNASLKETPFRGISLVCPYTPDLPDKSPAGVAAFGRFVAEQLIPRARVETGSRPDRGITGIDGVSMGGRLALLVGLSRPDIFGSVGALQPALKPSEGPMISELARAAMEKFPIELRLVSSEADPFLPAVRAVSERLRADGVVHELLIAQGNHDYDWNRGPGGVEMLLWHERVLRGFRPP
jgi:enterochelin esterase-like enzyme